MKIITYNINGIRAGLKKGLASWIEDHDYDIICFQETKAHPEQVDAGIFEHLGYYANWVSAEKKGYSGCLTLSKKKPSLVVQGMGVKKFDNEGRVLRTDFGKLTVLNCYFPSGSAGEHRQEIKMKFLKAFRPYSRKLLKERPNMIIVGDYNIANHEIDIHNPKSNKKTPGFLPDERAWLTKMWGYGFNDAFRITNPELVEYSWWSIRSNARAQNKGWRIDYQAVSDPIAPKIKSCNHLADVKHSDHCPVLLDINI